ncbi:E3 ubiquitin-protein ligase TRIM21-like [Nothobranchius furzeri]|uniref:E3 ubiquitin-protein ligase TRIM21-like n=2 Tax=Nothobranchius furzeri TaxID=105023 RepID=A0A9D3C0I6_NOTFU|nr:E3 ubiquitin-protein ligase TRIM21-like [Nothobranchius furzeri]
MSFQICSCCGWSKVTTYQGLRTHQGKKGCTPKGTSVPQSQQFTYLPKIALLSTPIHLEDPFVNILKTSMKSESETFSWMNKWEESSQRDNIPVLSPSFLEREALVSPNFITQMNSAPAQVTMPPAFKPPLQIEPRALEMEPNLDRNGKSLGSTFGAQLADVTPLSPTLTSQMSHPTTQTSVNHPSKSLSQTQQHALQQDANVDKNHEASGFIFGTQQTGVMPQPQLFNVKMNPPTKQPKSSFETPPPFRESFQTSSEKARRTLDFSTVSVKEDLQQLPSTLGLETVMQEKEREAKRVLQAWQDKMRADLKQKMYVKEQKMAEVITSVKLCQDRLEAEWMEINNVFSEVIKVVEDARQKALDPVEIRRQQVKRESSDLLLELQKQIDSLKDSLDELDELDLQNPVLPNTNESTSWGVVKVETSFSFGSLKATTSTMMKEIQKKLENLSSLGGNCYCLATVDVKLDSSTAHQCLILSEDKKKVRDGGMKPNLSNAPERFDTFGSVLGMNVITSGKSYWEVEVSNKTGWDLGVARRKANRKGILSVNSDNGFWVTVHYENTKYAALTVPPTSLPLEQKPQKVGVFVDYEGGLVSFYDVTNRSHIYSFTECSFRDQIVPYFSPHLTVKNENAAPLVISAVRKH